MSQQQDETSTDPETARAIQAVRNMLDINLYVARRKGTPFFDNLIIRSFRVITASGSPGTASSRPSPRPTSVLELHVSQDFCNLNGIMHGGAIATTLDMASATSLAPIQSPGYWDFMGGLSRTLNVSFLKAVPAGVTVRIFNEVVRHGRTTVLLRSRMEDGSGNVFATVEHHKIMAEPPQWVEGMMKERIREREMGRERKEGEEVEGKKKREGVGRAKI